MRVRKPVDQLIKEAEIQHAVDLLWVDMQLAVAERDLDRIIMTYKRIIYATPEEVIEY